MDGKRYPLGGASYKQAWTDTAKYLRTLPQPGLSWTYSFAERAAKAAFDACWVMPDSAWLDCEKAARTHLINEAAERLAINAAARSQGAENG